MEGQSAPDVPWALGVCVISTAKRASASSGPVVSLATAHPDPVLEASRIVTTTPWWGKLTSRLGTDQNCRAGIIAREGGAVSNYLFALDATGNFQLLRGTGPPSGASGDCAPAASGLGALPEGIWVDDVRVSQP